MMKPANKIALEILEEMGQHMEKKKNLLNVYLIGGIVRILKYAIIR